jgi:hypothetical protein
VALVWCELALDNKREIDRETFGSTLCLLPPVVALDTNEDEKR